MRRRTSALHRVRLDDRVLRHLARRHGAERRLDRRARLRRIEVAGHDDDRVARHVPGVEEVLHVLQRGGLQVLVLPDDRVVIGMPGGPEHLRQDQLGRAVRRVLVRLAALVAHDAALQVDLLLRHVLAERLEAVGVEPEQRGQRLGRAEAVISGAIVRGEGVVLRPLRLHDHVELVARHARRAHEHQVLEQVREAGASRRLVLRSHAEAGGDHRDRQPVVLLQDDRQAVGQGEGRGGEGGRAGGRSGRRGGGGEGGAGDQDHRQGDRDSGGAGQVGPPRVRWGGGRRPAGTPGTR